MIARRQLIKGGIGQVVNYWLLEKFKPFRIGKSSVQIERNSIAPFLHITPRIIWATIPQVLETTLIYNSTEAIHLSLGTLDTS